MYRRISVTLIIHKGTTNLYMLLSRKDILVQSKLHKMTICVGGKRGSREGKSRSCVGERSWTWNLEIVCMILRTFNDGERRYSVLGGCTRIQIQNKIHYFLKT